MMYKIIDYLTADGRDPVKEWLSSLSDRRTRARVLARLQRMAAGNFGDCKALANGVWELRIDHGPGYRIYYARAGEKLLLLLAGGDKSKQHTDINIAIAYWKDWNRRNAP